MIRRPPRSTQSRSSAASDVYKRQYKSNGFDAVSPNSPGVAFLRFAKKRFQPRYLLPRLLHKLQKQPVQYKYADFMEHNLVDPGHGDFYPSVVPNWDNTAVSYTHLTLP